MCGLVGILSIRDKKIDKDELAKSLTAISYRGPDAEGLYDDEKIILGHRRLSIIDLSENANQPMRLKCRKSSRDIIIAFNGEIYNYKELLKELENSGHKFNSNSDTEVILHSFEEWGSDCFKKLRGMFAVALWDKANEKLILARDRFGIKPLYYYKNENYFVFASEIKAILNFNFVQKQINWRAVKNFLNQGWISQPQTIFENIFALESGMILKINKSGLSVECFADIKDDFLREKEKIGFNDAVKKTKSALLNSVSTHLVSDVEVGCFLSGGIDSSALVALMKELKQEKITTVSTIFKNTKYDESEKIKIVSEKFKTNHINLEISGRDFLENLDNIFSHIDEPTADGVNTYFVSMAAKKAGLKVVLSGLGGDELFWGYPSFIDIPKIIKFMPLLKNSLAQKILYSKLKNNPFNQKLAKLREFTRSNREYTNQAQIYELLKIYLTYRGLFTNDQIEKILNRQIGNCELKIENYEQKFDDIQHMLSYFEFVYYMRNQLLRDSDVFSMAHSIELRVPFIDNVFLETIIKIPNKYKFKNRVSKFLLREALKNLLPNEILNQKKQGFVLPIDLWLKNEARELVKNEMLSSKIYNRDVINSLLNKFYSGKLHWSRIWSLFVLNKFLHKYL